MCVYVYMCLCVCVMDEFTITVKLGLIQLVVGTDKEKNVTQLIREAVNSGAEIVVLPVSVFTVRLIVEIVFLCIAFFAIASND